MVKAFKNMDRHNSLSYSRVDGPKKPSAAGGNKWIFVTVLIALYGFLKNISPESTYMAEFFVGPRFNFTREQVTQEIYPVSIYSSVLQTCIVLLVTDILRYKPVVVVGAAGFVLHKALLVWGHTLLEVQGNQFFWGTYKACTLAYKTYIYGIVDKEHYQIVTAVIRIAPKAGTLFSSILSQVCLSVFFLTIEHLNAISLSTSVVALICAILLPSMKKSIYFNKDKLVLPLSNEGEAKEVSRCCSTVRVLWKDFKDAYTNPYIVKWSIWWVLATGGFQQVTDYYVQILWTEISGVRQNKYNAGVEAVSTVVSGVACYIVGNLKVDWFRQGEIVLVICTMLKGVALLYSASATSIVYSYELYIVFCALYDIMMVISNSEVAKHLKNDSFALIFGTNTFLALCCQSLLTYLFSSKHVFALKIQNQFVIVGVGFLLLAVGYTIKALLGLCCCRDISHPGETTPIIANAKVPKKPSNFAKPVINAEE